MGTATRSNWHVITGAPSSGKTTVLQRLGEEGFSWQEEMARIYIDREIVKGKTVDDIRRNEAVFQEGILQMKFALEARLSPNKLTFFDRGIPDTLAYYELIGHSYASDLVARMKRCRYKKVFVFDLLSFEKDYARTESQRETQRLDRLLECVYKELGNDVVRVPVMDIEERVTFVKEHALRK